LNPGDLDGILSKHHFELAELVTGGGQFGVSQEELEEFIERFGEVGEFVQEAIDQSGDDAELSLLEMFRHFDGSESGQIRLPRQCGVQQPTVRSLMVPEQLGPISAAPLPSSQRAL
jgi:hypothetical protein